MTRPRKSSKKVNVSFRCLRHLFFKALSSYMVVSSPHMVKIQPFSPVFPLAESIVKAFCWLTLWDFKGKSINRFLGYVVN